MKQVFGINRESMYGVDLGKTGTCRHYHSELDIAGLLCAACHKFYACYDCHDALENHQFAATDKNSEQHAVLCGVCGQTMTYSLYKGGECPNCHSPFNPRCELHENVYFN